VKNQLKYFHLSRLETIWKNDCILRKNMRMMLHHTSPSRPLQPPRSAQHVKSLEDSRPLQISEDAVRKERTMSVPKRRIEVKSGSKRTEILLFMEILADPRTD
jgi:hypothetical protein